VASTECRLNSEIATQEPIPDNLGCAEEPEAPTDLSTLPSPREVDLLARYESPPVALDGPSPYERMLSVAQEADALLHASMDLGPVEGETPSGLELCASSFNGYTAEEEGESSFAEGEDVEILVDPPEQEGEARQKNGELGFVPSDYYSPAAVVHEPKVMEPILSSGPPPETTRDELPNIARALHGTTAGEDEEILFAKGKELVPFHREDAEGQWETPEADGNTGLVPSTHSFAPATSSPPSVIQAAIPLPDPAAAPAMPAQSERAEAHMTADPPEGTEIASMPQPATDARQNNEGFKRNNATSLCPQVWVSLATKSGAQRAKKVSPSTPYFDMSLVHMQTQRQGHGKPLTPEYLFGMPFSQLRRLAEQRGIDVGGEKEELVNRLLSIEE